jgi:hypothetical protein
MNARNYTARAAEFDADYSLPDIAQRLHHAGRLALEFAQETFPERTK